MENRKIQILYNPTDFYVAPQLWGAILFIYRSDILHKTIQSSASVKPAASESSTDSRMVLISSKPIYSIIRNMLKIIYLQEKGELY